MSDEEKDRGGAAVRIPPPLVPIVALGIGFAASWLFGDLPNPIAGTERFAIGGLLVLAGLGLIAIAFGLFQKSGQDPAPWASSPELIAEGIYRWTRNPMYLGMGLAQAGLGALFSNMWIVALVPLTWVVIYFIAIRHEEAYLESTFGAPYLEYKKSVRRWL